MSDEYHDRVSCDVVESDEDDDIGFTFKSTFVKKEESLKPEVILKSALDEKDFAEEEFHYQQIDNLDFQGFERTEPLVTQTVEADFLLEHFGASNVVDLISERKDSSDLFTNPFYQDQTAFGISQFSTGNPFSLKEESKNSVESENFARQFEQDQLDKFYQQQDEEPKISIEAAQENYPSKQEVFANEQQQEEEPAAHLFVAEQSEAEKSKLSLESASESLNQYDDCDHASFQYQKELSSSSSVEKCVFDQQEKEKDVEEEYICEVDFVTNQGEQVSSADRFDLNKNPFSDFDCQPNNLYRDPEVKSFELQEASEGNLISGDFGNNLESKDVNVSYYQDHFEEAAILEPEIRQEQADQRFFSEAATEEFSSHEEVLQFHQNDDFEVRQEPNVVFYQGPILYNFICCKW